MRREGGGVLTKKYIKIYTYMYVDLYVYYAIYLYIGNTDYQASVIRL